MPGPAATNVAKRLSEPMPKEQAVELRELVKKPFPARHHGTAVTVQAVFVRTAIVRGDDGPPYQVAVGNVEVDEVVVEVVQPGQARRLTPRRRLDGSDARPARIRAIRDASDRRAERDRRRRATTRRDWSR